MNWRCAKHAQCADHVLHDVSDDGERKMVRIERAPETYMYCRTCQTCQNMSGMISKVNKLGLAFCGDQRVI